MAIFVADACRLKCIGIQAQRQELQKTLNTFICKLFFRLFSNVCTFRNTSEGSQDVRADSKLVDISY